MRKTDFILLLQPIVLALFPVVHMISENASEVYSLHALFAIFFVTILTCVLFFISSGIYGSYKKGALVSNFTIMLFYGLQPVTCHILIPLSKAFLVFRVRYALMFIGLLFLCGLLFLFRRKATSSFILSALLIPFLALNIFDLSKYIYKRIMINKSKQHFIQIDRLKKQELALMAAGVRNKIEDFPDIYFIILDAYLSNASLEKLLNFDNTPFTEALRTKGFYLTTESRSLYPNTAPSVFSTLNYSINSSKTKLPSTKCLGRNSNARHFLEQLGYTYVDLSQNLDDTYLFNGQNYYDIKKERESLWGEAKAFLLGNQFFMHAFMKHMTPNLPNCKSNLPLS